MAGSAQATPLEVRTRVLGALENNVYVAACPTTGAALIIDPADEAEEILAEAAGLSIVGIALTHGHGDHLGALAGLRRTLGPPVFLHPDDAPLAGVTDARPLADGDVLRVGRLGVRVLHTPGHTPGSVCYLTAGHLFSGDALFPGGPGATVGPAAFARAIASLRSRLFILPDATVVLPGHGPSTTIGTERPYLDEWERRGW